MIITKFENNKKASHRSKMFLNPLAFKLFKKFYAIEKKKAITVKNLIKFKLEIQPCKPEVEDKKNN